VNRRRDGGLSIDDNLCVHTNHYTEGIYAKQTSDRLDH
jgi:hypothetical protein